MAEQDYFSQALSNFMFETASGGAIRHLADHGYTAEEISKKLDFPTPFDRIQSTIWKHFLDKGIVILDEPGTGKKRQTFDFVAEYDQYGRRTFRKVALQDFDEEIISWEETTFHEEQDGPLLLCLSKHCEINREDAAYISCDFGLMSRREPEHFHHILQFLEESDQKYILGLPWERMIVYHRLNERMRRIAAGLYQKGEYHGWCYFMNEKVKMRI